MTAGKMKWLDLTMPAPAGNLALDEALLDCCDAGDEGELLRFWESPAHFVVTGYANKIQKEVNLNACRRNGIPVLRRCSGGGTVLQGPGCLNYSLVLRIDHGLNRSITGTNQFVMERHRTALTQLLRRRVEIQGHTDLAIGGLKFSGNAQRRRQRFLIFHGTFLVDFNLRMVEEFLSMPSREPEYRNSRPHGDFLMNLPLSREQIKTALRQAWNVSEPLQAIPACHSLVREKYDSDEWNLKF
jgi:lipoate---protein ligase